MKVFKNPSADRELLEAMVLLEHNQHFGLLVEWIKTAAQRASRKQLDTGDDVLRGHCQALNEFLETVEGARENLSKLQKRELENKE